MCGEVCGAATSWSSLSHSAQAGSGSLQVPAKQEVWGSVVKCEIYDTLMWADSRGLQVPVKQEVWGNVRKCEEVWGNKHSEYRRTAEASRTLREISASGKCESKCGAVASRYGPDARDGAQAGSGNFHSEVWVKCGYA